MCVCWGGASRVKILTKLRFNCTAHPVTTEVPPGYDGSTSWFKYADAVEEWCDLTKIEAKRRGPAIAVRLSGHFRVHFRAHWKISVSTRNFPPKQNKKNSGQNLRFACSVLI